MKLWLASLILGFCLPAGAGIAIDDFMQKLGGSIPFPPEKMITKLHAQGIDAIGVAVMPHGRSLERRSTDYENPRTMMSFYLGPESGMEQPDRFVFVAYTPKLHQLEIIGSSLKLPQDFLVVQDYREGAVDATPEPPQQGVGLCLACHQNGGPIFPNTSPGSFNVWSETNSNALVREKMLAEPHLDPLAAQWLANVREQVQNVGRFDFTVRTASRSCPRFYRSCPGIKLPSSLLYDRTPLGHENEIRAGINNDPLFPRRTDNGDDGILSPSPYWTISLTRDGTVSIPSATPVRLFAMYCSNCHAGPDAVAPPLPLHDLNALKNYQGAAHRTVNGLLSDKIMPPISSALPSPEDRRRMIQALQ